MSVLLITSLGEIVIDLYVDDCPKACTNFIKLCKIKYYNNCLFYNVQKDYLAQCSLKSALIQAGRLQLKQKQQLKPKFLKIYQKCLN